MFGSRRHPALGWDQSFFALLSVLALLAFALFPVAASADSSGYEYENAVPTPYGGTHKEPTVVGGGGGEDDEAHASNKGGGTGGGTGPGSDGGSSGGGDAGTTGGQASGEDKGGNGSTNPQHAGNGKDAAGQKASLKAVPSPNAESDDGGSSPVVPILIVLALLAAISVGVVVWQRRRGDTPPITPKAG